MLTWLYLQVPMDYRLIDGFYPLSTLYTQGFGAGAACICHRHLALDRSVDMTDTNLEVGLSPGEGAVLCTLVSLG